MKLTLHIGTEKTGSTSIQHALAARREELLAAGILYPRLFGSENHTEVAVAAMGPRPNDPLQIQETTHAGMDHAGYAEAVSRRLGEEIDAAGVETLLISNEHCHSRLTDLDSIRRILDVIGRPVTRVEVIVYLRRQDRMAVSMHSTRLRDGGRGTIFPVFREPPAYYDFHRLMANYAEVFGAGSIRARLFEREHLVGGDVVADFFALLGLAVSLPPAARANLSLSRQQARFLEMFNERFPLIVDGRLNPARGPVMAAVHKTLRGQPGRPARAQAMAFQTQFADVNRLARDRFLPGLDRSTLFDDDFSDYPEQDETAWPLTEDELMAFTAALWSHAQRAR